MENTEKQIKKAKIEILEEILNDLNTEADKVREKILSSGRNRTYYDGYEDGIFSVIKSVDEKIKKHKND